LGCPLATTETETAWAIEIWFDNNHYLIGPLAETAEGTATAGSLMNDLLIPQMNSNNLTDPIGEARDEHRYGL